MTLRLALDSRPQSQSFQSCFTGYGVGTCLHPCHFLSNLCSGVCAMAGLQQKDSSPSHACDLAWVFGVSLFHNLVFGTWAGDPTDIPGLLDLSSGTCAVHSPLWDPAQIPTSKASSWFP